MPKNKKKDKKKTTLIYWGYLVLILLFYNNIVAFFASFGVKEIWQANLILLGILIFIAIKFTPYLDVIIEGVTA